MLFDVLIEADLRTAGETALRAEELGFDALWTSETAHDPFLSLGAAALATSRVGLGTAIAVAFPRSPTITAHTAWDLAAASGGRFMLGLGTQVKAHIERRFGVPWGSPVEQLRDYIGAVRAVWHTWQTGERLRYEGPFYNLKLMTPFFSPEPLADPTWVPPVYIAGVNRQLCRLAGAVCDGFHVHPFHTTKYLQEYVVPWITEGLTEAGRKRSSVQVAAGMFVVVGKGAERDRMREEVRRQVAFYASTPSYRTVLAAHGWEDKGEELSRLASRGRWDRMAELVSDEMLAECTIEGDTLPDVARAIKACYDGLLDRVAPYLPYTPGQRDDEWREACAVVKGN